MNLVSLLRILRARSELRSHARWDRTTLLAKQAAAVAELRRWAVAASPFYRELHHGLEDAPLERLPIVTKAMLMERFDAVVTDPEVRLADVERHLRSATVTDLYRGRYRVAATGGTTGRRGVFLSNPDEWRFVMASYARAFDWGGARPGLTSRVRMAVVSSRNPSHQSAIVGATAASRFLPTLRLDATQPLDDIRRSLTDFQPGALVGYASMLGLLAEEQLAGRLAIHPSAIFSASEVLTSDARARLRAAFSVEPTNVYAATEPAGIASECRLGRMHRYEDLVLAEVVDDDGQPVANGEFGSRVLVTVLFSRTQPLIRYELSDRVQRLDGPCPDGLPFGLIGSIEGRREEVLRLSGAMVQPNVFHRALERLPVSGWQVIARGESIEVLLARPFGGVDPGEVAANVRTQLERAGAGDVHVAATIVDEIPRTALGKAPLIRSEPVQLARMA